MATKAYHCIVQLLKQRSIAFEHFEHEHVHSSHDAAIVRGTKLEEAAKAIVLETGSKELVQCVVAGHRKVDLKKLRVLLGERDVHLADPERVLSATGCTVGSVAPFGNLCNPKIPVYADQELFSREYIVFSAGSHYHSIRMLVTDWQTVAQPTIIDIGKRGSDM